MSKDKPFNLKEILSSIELKKGCFSTPEELAAALEREFLDLIINVRNAKHRDWLPSAEKFHVLEIGQFDFETNKTNWRLRRSVLVNHMMKGKEK